MHWVRLTRGPDPGLQIKIQLLGKCWARKEHCAGYKSAGLTWHLSAHGFSSCQPPLAAGAGQGDRQPQLRCGLRKGPVCCARWPEQVLEHLRK